MLTDKKENRTDDLIQRLTSTARAQKKASPRGSGTPADAAPGAKRTYESKGVSRVMCTYTLDPQIIRKIKYIARMSGYNMNEVIEEYLQRGIRKYEKENGEITPREMKIPSRQEI